jgi:hypothetical protein
MLPGKLVLIWLLLAFEGQVIGIAYCIIESTRQLCCTDLAPDFTLSTTAVSSVSTGTAVLVGVV